VIPAVAVVVAVVSVHVVIPTEARAFRAPIQPFDKKLWSAVALPPPLPKSNFVPTQRACQQVLASVAAGFSRAAVVGAVAVAVAVTEVVPVAVAFAVAVVVRIFGSRCHPDRGAPVAPTRDLSSISPLPFRGAALFAEIAKGAGLD
jgi:hypothetical protein